MEKQKIHLKKISGRSAFRMPAFGESPESDWKIIFVSTILLSVTAIVVAGFIFIKIGRGEIFTIERGETSGDRSLNLERLQEEVSYYEEKAADFERLRSAPTPAVDPSI